MNAVEIEDAVSALSEQPFDAAGFPFAFLEAFGNREATIRRQRTGASNRTIADLHDPENMPADLREAHARNNEVLERIYIGRRFRNDPERQEKLFELYTRVNTGRENPQSGATKKDRSRGPVPGGALAGSHRRRRPARF